MEQDVEPHSRSSCRSRGWGHDDLTEVPPPESNHDERPRPQSDKKSRMRSKRPDQKIYVPRGRRREPQETENKPGHQSHAPDEPPITHEVEQKSRPRAGKGRGKASAERYVPKPKRNSAASDSMHDMDRRDYHGEGQYANPEEHSHQSTEMSQSSHSHDHKKTRTKISRQESEKYSENASEKELKSDNSSIVSESTQSTPHVPVNAEIAETNQSQGSDIRSKSDIMCRESDVTAMLSEVNVETATGMSNSELSATDRQRTQTDSGLDRESVVDSIQEDVQSALDAERVGMELEANHPNESDVNVPIESHGNLRSAEITESDQVTETWDNEAEIVQENTDTPKLSKTMPQSETYSDPSAFASEIFSSNSVVKHHPDPQDSVQTPDSHQRTQTDSGLDRESVVDSIQEDVQSALDAECVGMELEANHPNESDVNVLTESHGNLRSAEITESDQVTKTWDNEAEIVQENTDTPKTSKTMPQSETYSDPSAFASEIFSSNSVVKHHPDPQDSVQTPDSHSADVEPQEGIAEPHAVIKRENSFIENFETDKTLQVHYSENCQYDHTGNTEVEILENRGASERFGPEDISSINDTNEMPKDSSVEPPDTNISKSESSCDSSLPKPLKRQKSDEIEGNNEPSQDGTDTEVASGVKDFTVLPNTEQSMAVENVSLSEQRPVVSEDNTQGDPDSALKTFDAISHTEKLNNVPDSDNAMKQNELPMDISSNISNKSTEVSTEPQILPEQQEKKSVPKKTKVAKETPNDGDTVKPVAMETAEDSWDAMFDDDGEALDPSIMEELTEKVGKVKVQKTQFDYLDFQPTDPELDEELYDHLVEIYDFPSNFITRDILAVFRSYQDKGFDLKWVDDTHCIGIFSSKIAAQSALGHSNALLKVRPISAASRQTKMKAKKNVSTLEPYKPRPVTTAAVARNLVTNALGLTARIPREKRDEERRKLREARDKKKEAKQQEIDVWDGKIGRCAMDEV